MMNPNSYPLQKIQSFPSTLCLKAIHYGTAHIQVPFSYLKFKFKILEFKAETWQRMLSGNHFQANTFSISFLMKCDSEYGNGSRKRIK